MTAHPEQKRTPGRQELSAYDLLVVIAFFALIRFQYRNVPLERDEGEYAYSD